MFVEYEAAAGEEPPHEGMMPSVEAQQGRRTSGNVPF
jgi:hypothetical protein